MFMSFLIGVSYATSGTPTNVLSMPPPDFFVATTTMSVSDVSLDIPLEVNTPIIVPNVPFYSQFQDIHEAAWKKIGCGITSLAMIIEFYHPGVVSVDTLLHEGVMSGAYIKGAGWSHQGLVRVGEHYGLEGRSYDLAGLDTATAFAQFKEFLIEGPVIASVHYKFDPKSTIPHLAVITGIAGDRVYYNDPAGRAPRQFISTADFLKSWKKRFIVLRPLP